VQTECFLYSSPKAGLNAVPTDDPWPKETGFFDVWTEQWLRKYL